MTVDPPPDPRQRLAEVARKRADRRRRWRLFGEGSIGRNLGQIGALGWTIILPALIGLGIGRWLDRETGSRIFWTAPLLLIGLAAGCWSGWRWITRR
ncbi:MAG: AtpZ/AtpI family protein [Candidatus Sphingomonas colombiensis]|nr:AtpZ/AtpI family protein [Sphingomonas sp.]WEK43235.1 MAG: AtpZ/AtpI family protein [Sphingomonas sp.]